MDLILIGGVSGSGKGVALAALEDSGYYSASHLPMPLILETVEYLRRAGQERIAVTLDLRTDHGIAESRRHAGGAARGRLERPLPDARREDRHPGQALLRDAPAASLLQRRRAR